MNKINHISNDTTAANKTDPFEGHTPLMRQYLQFKQKVGNALLFFRVGDFYELFLDDAKRAHELLGLTLTARGNSAGTPIAMSGVPWMALDTHLQKLIKMGHCAAVVDQMPQTYLPDGSKAPIERTLTKLITPGTIVDETLLDDHEHPLLVCCLPLFSLPEANNIKSQLEINGTLINSSQNIRNSMAASNSMEDGDTLNPAFSNNKEPHYTNSTIDRIVVFGSVASSALTCMLMNNIQWLEFLSTSRAREILYPNNCSVMSLFWGSFDDPSGVLTFANLCAQSNESALAMRFAKSEELKLFTQSFFQGTLSAIEPHYFGALNGLSILQKHFADYPFALQTLGITISAEDQDYVSTILDANQPNSHQSEALTANHSSLSSSTKEQPTCIPLIKTVNVKYLEEILLNNKNAPLIIQSNHTSSTSEPTTEALDNFALINEPTDIESQNNNSSKTSALLFAPTVSQRNKCVEIKKTIQQQLLHAHLSPSSNQGSSTETNHINLLRPYLHGTLGALFEYTRMALSLQKAPIEQVLLVNDDGRLQIDAASVRALEIFTNSGGQYAASGSLLYSLGSPPTNSSKRLMGQLLACALSDLEAILMRCAILYASAKLQQKFPLMHDLLKKVSESKIDLERYCAKINVQNIPNSQYPELIKLLSHCQEISKIVCTKDSASFWRQSTTEFLKEKTIGLSKSSFEKLQQALEHYFKCLALSLKESHALLCSLKILLHPDLFKQSTFAHISRSTKNETLMHNQEHNIGTLPEEHQENLATDGASFSPTEQVIQSGRIDGTFPVGTMPPPTDDLPPIAPDLSASSVAFTVTNSLIDYLHPSLDTELSTLKLLAKDVNLALEEFCLQERQRSGISTLKIDSIKNQGFFITVPKSQISKVPQDYQLASTLKSAQRYKLDSLDALERKSSDAKLRLEQITRQYQSLFNQLLLAHSAALGALGWTLDVFHLSAHLDLFNQAIAGSTKYVDIQNYSATDFASGILKNSFENSQLNDFLQKISQNYNRTSTTPAPNDPFIGAQSANIPKINESQHQLNASAKHNITNSTPGISTFNNSTLDVNNAPYTNGGNNATEQINLNSKEIFIANKMYHPSILFNHIKNDIQQNNFTLNNFSTQNQQSQFLDSVNFVPNDLQLLASQSLLITGPNMGGKSTFMRSAALCAYLAACGLPISAKEFVITPKKSIFCRIGAQDDLSAGQSTFMVEMLQSAKMLQNANEQSFCIVDEIGRGTSTYDGVSIAFGALHHLVHHNRAQSLFCTHYFELTEAAPAFAPISPFNLPAVNQAHFEAIFDEHSHKLHFTHKLLPGATNKSYGLDVAKMALIPAKALQEAKTFLHFLHQNDSLKNMGPNSAQGANIVSAQGANIVTTPIFAQSQPDQGSAQIATPKAITNEQTHETQVSQAKQKVLDLLENLQIDEISPKLLYDKIYEALKK